MKADNKTKLQVGVLFVLAICAVVGYTIANPSGIQTKKQTQAPTASWRPRKEVKGARFVGSNACTECHSKLSTLQQGTVMAHALALPADCRILASHKELTFRSGPYFYRIVRNSDRSLFTVTNGTETISEPILFCFGQGKAGQTYLFKHNDSFYEGRLSFFNEINGLDYTIGHPRTAPPTLAEAAGRAISPDEAQNCFSCHATGAVSDNRLQLDRLMPGVSCEDCHGPGEKHVLAMKSQEAEDSYIFNPAKLDADALAQEFCGACHRSVDEVSRMPQLGGGINNVRFQPYRLFNSRGHDPTDARLSCTACHDVHKDLQRDSAFYDAKCLACHQSGASSNPVSVKVTPSEQRMAKQCPVGRQNCVTCHMPQVQIPGSHFKFTDHRIRIVRPGDPYPN
jgi:hypothetical protein